MIGQVLRSLTIISLSAAVLAPQVYAQRRQVVTDELQCARCRIKVDSVVSFGRATDDEWLNNYPSVQRLPRQRWVVFGSIPRSKLLIYDSVGDLLSTLGREGDGPGEFRGIWRLKRLPGDSILVIDWETRRLTVFDADGRYARSLNAPFAILDLEPFSANVWVAAGMAFTEEHIGFPLHRLSASGAIEHSFGGDVTVLQHRPSAAQRVITADSGGVWAGRHDRYEIEYWSLSGVHRTTLDRKTSWFPDREDEGSRDSWQMPIQPRIRDLYRDPDGRLWVIAVAARPGWQPSPQNWGGIETDEQNLETIIEVIDPQEGVLVARERFAWIGWSFTDDGDIVTYHHDRDGVMVVTLLRPSVIKPGG